MSFCYLRVGSTRRNVPVAKPWQWLFCRRCIWLVHCSFVKKQCELEIRLLGSLRWSRDRPLRYLCWGRLGVLCDTVIVMMFRWKIRECLDLPPAPIWHHIWHAGVGIVCRILGTLPVKACWYKPGDFQRSELWPGTSWDCCTLIYFRLWSVLCATCVCHGSLPYTIRALADCGGASIRVPSCGQSLMSAGLYRRSVISMHVNAPL